jgi:hypothetical protein
LLEIEASGLGVPLRAASCCSRAFDSKYSSQAAASCNRYTSIYLRNEDFCAYIIYIYLEREYARVPESLDHQTQVWPAISGEWFVHAERLESMLPSKKVQWLLHDSWLLSEQAKILKISYKFSLIPRCVFRKTLNHTTWIAFLNNWKICTLSLTRKFFFVIFKSNTTLLNGIEWYNHLMIYALQILYYFTQLSKNTC